MGAVKMQLSREEIAEKYGYDYVGFFLKGLATVRKGSKEFHVRPDGKPAYKERYDFVESFSEGLARVVNKDGQWFHIRPDGTPAYKERYDFVESFSGDLAYASKGDEWFHICPDGTRVD